jgi:hypothetical protein
MAGLSQEIVSGGGVRRVIKGFIICEVRILLACNNGLLLSFFRSGGMIARPFIALERDVRRLMRP